MRKTGRHGAAPRRGASFAALAVLLGAAGLASPPVAARAEEKLVVENVKDGQGAEAVRHATLTVHYTGRLQDGTKFDSSLDRGDPFQFLLGAGQVIRGWDIGMEGMRVGGERRLVIPAHLGYGAAGAGSIPPNATLIFDVSLLDVTPPPYDSVDPAGLAAAREEGVVILDIRGDGELRADGVISGAVPVAVLDANGQPFPDFQQRLMAAAPPDAPVIVLDGDGELSSQLAYWMGSGPWKSVSHLSGGLASWRKAGRSLEPYAP